jgi:predicted DNA-binding transcriptional regulator AlpA
MAMLSTEEAAKRMGVDSSTLRGWRSDQVGPPYFRISRQCIRYDDRDVDAYIAARRYDPSARANLERKANAAL